jgi:hypothetical protein
VFIEYNLFHCRLLQQTDEVKNEKSGFSHIVYLAKAIEKATSQNPLAKANGN